MHRFLVRRLIRVVAVALGAVGLGFVLLHVSGDPVAVMLPPDAPAEYVARVRHEMGLDQPLWIQFLIFAGNLARGDFGYSFTQRQPAATIIVERLPATYELLAAAMLVAIAVSVPLGVMAGVRRGSLWERAAESLELIGQAVPAFWLGITLILVFAVQIPILPVSGRGTPAHLVLPAITLAAFIQPAIMRMMRISIQEVLACDYVRTARAKGIAERVVITRHVIQNALVPVIAVGGFQVTILIGGAVIIETVFAWPGVGRAMVQAIWARDFPVVLAGVLILAIQTVLINLLVDLWHAALDPRVRLG